ncbi:MAG: ribonuclease Z [Bacteroidetes bacterium]|nr:ribonuclease Z [Bacteroidota bacterium]
MNLQKLEKHTLIEATETDFETFRDAFDEAYPSFVGENLILNLHELQGLSTQNLLTFSKLQKKHRRAKKSFVVVYLHADFNDFPDDFQLVPTLQEAEDLIEMEEIERDLGF